MQGHLARPARLHRPCSQKWLSSTNEIHPFSRINPTSSTRSGIAQLCPKARSHSPLPTNTQHTSRHNQSTHPHPSTHLCRSAATEPPPSSAPASDTSILEPDEEPYDFSYYDATIAPLMDQVYSPLTADLPDDDLQSLASDWGYTRLGRPFPSGATSSTLARSLPPSAYNYSPVQLPLALTKGISIYLLCSLALTSSLLPPLLYPLLWFLMGTSYLGLFTVASSCAHYAALPTAPFAQDLLGAFLMAPSLYPFITYRAQYLGHILRPNTLDYDSRVWRPTTLRDYLSLPPLRAALLHLIQGTPLKFLSSIGHWFKCFDSFDLRPYFKDNRGGFLAGWILPALFAGYVIPELLVSFGLSGLFNLYLCPMLFFHVGLSTLSLVAHRGPHIPWKPYGPTWDEGQAIVNGTVTVRLPRWLEWLINDANYTLPRLVSTYVPWYNTKAAHEAMQESVGAYCTEATLNLRLLQNLVQRWQLFDEEAQTFVPFPTAEILTDANRAELEAELDKLLGRDAREKLQGGLQVGVDKLQEGVGKVQEGVEKVLTDENVAKARELSEQAKQVVDRLAGGVQQKGGAAGTA